MAVTIRDVANEVGVSTPVVSTVLHGSKGNTRMSETTRQRVVETAARLGYRPHFGSRSLARRRSQTLGLFIEPAPMAGFGYEYEGGILQGVETACREHDYDLLAISLGGSQTPEICSHKFVERRIDGLLLLHVRHDAEWVEPLCARHRNVVAVNYYGACEALDIINFDNLAAGRMAARFFAGLGHRAVGYLGSLDINTGPGTEQRRDGFVIEARRLGLAVRPDWILDAPNEAFVIDNEAIDYEERFGAVAAVIAALGSAGPTAWLAYNDMIAVRVCQALRHAGSRVPRDFSVMGIDNDKTGWYVDPPLTTLQQPLAEMGAQAVKQLIQRAEQGVSECPHGQMLSQPKLIERESSAPPTHAQELQRN